MIEKTAQTGLLWIGGLLLLLSGVLPAAARRGALTPVGDLPGGFRQPILALELAPDVAWVERIIGKPDDKSGPQTRDQARHSLQIDNRLIIPAYTLMFFLIGWALVSAGFRTAWWLTLAASLATALADYVENASLKRLLDDTGQLSLVRNAQFASCVKWVLPAETGC